MSATSSLTYGFCSSIYSSSISHLWSSNLPYRFAPKPETLLNHLICNAAESGPPLYHYTTDCYRANHIPPFTFRCTSSFFVSHIAHSESRKLIDIQYHITTCVVHTTLSCHRLSCALECPCFPVRIAVIEYLLLCLSIALYIARHPFRKAHQTDSPVQVAL